MATPRVEEPQTEPAWTSNARVRRSRARIIDAAIDLIVERGAIGLTVDAIAERSGVAKSTLYRHWSSLDELLVDVFRAAIPEPVEPDPADSFEDALRHQIAALGQVLSDPRMVRLLPSLVALGQQYPDIGVLVAEDRARKEDGLARILAAGAAAGHVPEGLDIRDVVALLLGPILGCALFGEPERIDDIGALTVERFLASYRT